MVGAVSPEPMIVSSRTVTLEPPQSRPSTRRRPRRSPGGSRRCPPRAGPAARAATISSWSMSGTGRRRNGRARGSASSIWPPSSETSSWVPSTSRSTSRASSHCVDLRLVELAGSSTVATRCRGPSMPVEQRAPVMRRYSASASSSSGRPAGRPGPAGGSLLRPAAHWPARGASPQQLPLGTLEPGPEFPSRSRRNRPGPLPGSSPRSSSPGLFMPITTACSMVAHRPCSWSRKTSSSARSRAARRDDGAALVVDVEHELGGLLLAVAEELLEDVGHVRHQVDRVVPDDDQPRPVGDDVLVRRWAGRPRPGGAGPGLDLPVGPSPDIDSAVVDDPALPWSPGRGDGAVAPRHRWRTPVGGRHTLGLVVPEPVVEPEHGHPDGGRAGDVEADEQCGQVAEVLRVPDRSPGRPWPARSRPRALGHRRRGLCPREPQAWRG